MPRLLFKKTGNAVWISHLDLMRLFHRAFKRAGLPLTHTQGFNPRPSVSIALPLSVGVESYCELLDFNLYNETVSFEEIKNRLNNVLTTGVEVLDVYDGGSKVGKLSLLQCRIILEYDDGVTQEILDAIHALFNKQSVEVTKKTKNGVQEQNIIPMIRRLEFAQDGDNCIDIKALICCQNPTLNPMQIPMAITRHLPDCKPDFARCIRLEVFDLEEQIFR